MELAKRILSWRKKAPPKTLQDPNVKYSLKLIEKEEISGDTKRFRLSLPSDQHVLGSPIGQHIYLSATINGKFVPRPYTPITTDDDKGYVDLVVKIYRRDVNPNFLDGGKMSQYLDEMKIGDCINVEGPTGDLIYFGNGKFSIRPNSLAKFETCQAKRLSMIAGGTGITPMLQLIRSITRNDNDVTQMRLIFANQTEEDILLRTELEEIAEKHADQFKIWFTLSRATYEWRFGNGFVSAEMIQEHLFPPSPDNLVLLCGPPPMVDYACTPSLEELNYDQNNIFIY